VLAGNRPTTQIGFHIDLDNDGDADNGPGYSAATDPFLNIMLATTPPSTVVAENVGTFHTATLAEAQALLNGPDGQPLPIDLFPSTPQEHWLRENFLTIDTSSFAANTADPDGDGSSNLLEYAFATDPRSPSSVRHPTLVPNPTTGGLTFTYLRMRDDLTYRVRRSTDLVTWNTTATNTGTVGGPVSYEGSAANPRRFFRLEVAP
jgi:hypothetical protein